MNDRDLLLKTASILDQNAGLICVQKVLIGLDGFVDEIISVVDQRESPTKYRRMETIAQLSRRIAESAGKSGNIELVVERVKLGGNGPILANALAQFGAQVTYLGALGYPRVHSVFEPLACRARALSFCEPGHTDALEFSDGKIMLGKHAPLRELTWDALCKRVGKKKLLATWRESALVAMTNWTMLPAMSDIWRQMQRELCPRLGAPRERMLFLDLADPTKRTTDELSNALRLIRGFQRWFKVTLGLNIKESSLVAQALGRSGVGDNEPAVEQRARFIAAKLKLDSVVVHSHRDALSVSGGHAARVRSMYTPRPLISTGAGDHFNAGYCLARLLRSSEAAALQMGVAVSGYYVRTARSPSRKELVRFLRSQAKNPS